MTEYWLKSIGPCAGLESPWVALLFERASTPPIRVVRYNLRTGETNVPDTLLDVRKPAEQREDERLIKGMTDVERARVTSFVMRMT